jgi:hypothetical protein
MRTSERKKEKIKRPEGGLRGEDTLGNQNDGNDGIARVSFPYS